MEEDKEEEGVPDPLVSGLHLRRVNPRAASGGGAWEDAPPLIPAPATFPPLFPSTVPTDSRNLRMF